MRGIAILAVASLFIAVLTYGSLRRWRWAFWVNLLLLGLFAVSAVQDGVLRTTFEYFSDPVGAVLLVACFVALARFGPWAVKRHSVAASPTS
jgi:hypothetical protein